ncbi:hypothetical protein Tco_1455203 [Tanacetum coccineum]
MTMTIQSSVKDKILTTPSKANVVVDALSRKERVKPRYVRAMTMTIQSEVRGMYWQPKVLVGSVMEEDMHQDLFKRLRLQCRRLLACCNILRYLSENEIESPWILSLNFQGQSSEYDVIWVIVDRLTKSAHFLAIREDFSTEKLARLYIDVIVA